MMPVSDVWDAGDPYEYFMGRWSRRMAPLFLNWLNVRSNLSWLDVGCGTGALSEAISKNSRPAYLCCIDPSSEFLEKTKERLAASATFIVGSASSIPKDDNFFDVVASGLALNFFPDLAASMREMKRVTKMNGTVAAYVWDYADRMDFLRIFWDAVSEVDPASHHLDEGVRFPVCNRGRLTRVFEEAGLTNVETSDLDQHTVFKNFEDYWNPFLGGQGPAGTYLASIDTTRQNQLKDTIERRLPTEKNGSIKLLARAIAVKGIKG